jgi:hypothetical protein
MREQFDRTAWIAWGQHGRVSWDQLIDAGIDRGRIDRWVADGRLRPVHRGVYAVGHQAPSVMADYVAAVLACGEGAVLSHRAAAYVLRLTRVNAPPEVTVPTTAGRRRSGIVIHRVEALHFLDTADLDGLRITTAPRALLDMAPSSKPADLARLCHEAWIHHGVTPELVEACIKRNPTKKGVARLQAAMRSDVTLSVLEDAFIALLRARRLALPRTNIDHQGDKVDCHWPDKTLTVELLSYRFHGSRQAFEADVARRRRSNHIAFTYGDVFERGAQTAAELATLLA